MLVPVLVPVLVLVSSWKKNIEKGVAMQPMQPLWTPNCPIGGGGVQLFTPPYVFVTVGHNINSSSFFLQNLG